MHRFSSGWIFSHYLDSVSMEQESPTVFLQVNFVKESQSPLSIVVHFTIGRKMVKKRQA